MPKAAAQTHAAGSKASSRPSSGLMAARPFAAQQETSEKLRQADDGKSTNVAAGPSFSFGKLPIQPKLRVGAVNDPLEHEAERVADQVMRMRNPGPSITGASPQISRKCAACEERDEDAEKLQMTPAAVFRPQTCEPPAIVQNVLQSHGHPLDSPTRAYFEPRFGHDFSGIRVHTDGLAAKSAVSIGASAYTAGSNIAFAAGRYSPATPAGRRLLAHELTHTIQQRAVPGSGRASNKQLVQRDDDGSNAANPDQVLPADDPYCLHMRPGEGSEHCEFTPKQHQTLSLVRYAALSLTSQALMNLSRGDPYMTTLARQVFHALDPDMNQIRSTTAQVLDNLRSKPVVCGTCADADCYEAGVVAYVTDDLSTIVLCQRFFLTSASQMRRTLIHEAGHAAGVKSSLTNVLEMYCPEDSEGCVDPCSNLTGDLTQNVDAWARFIECAAYSG